MSSTFFDTFSVRGVFLLPLDFPGGSDGKASASKAGDPDSIPGLGRSPGGGKGNPLQYSCLENPMDRGAWWATVHGAAKELDTTERLHFHFKNNSNDFMHTPVIKQAKMYF